MATTTDVTPDPDRAAALEWFARELPWHAAQCTAKHPWVSSIELRDRCVAAYLAGVKRGSDTEHLRWLRILVDWAKKKFKSESTQAEIEAAALTEPT